MRYAGFTPGTSLRAFGLTLSLVVAGLVVGASADDKPGLPTTACAVVKDAPKIDGVLDDPMWKDATEIKDFKDADGGAPKFATRLLVAHDDKNLYLAVESSEPPEKLKSLVANVKDHDGEGLWEDDSIEFFIDPTNHRKAWYHLIVNSKNVSLDGVHLIDDPTNGDLDWNPKYTSAAKVGDKSWVVEIAFPLDQFDRTATSSDTWAFNFLRNRQLDDTSKEYIYWSPISETAHTPSKFGTLTNMPVWKDRAVTKKMAD